MDITMCDGGPFADASIRERLKLYREMGATSVQTYIHWRHIEPQKGQCDWPAYDQTLEWVEEAGLRWIPFVIAGPWSETPEWAWNDPEVTLARCLEHGKQSKIPSIWCPKFKEKILYWLQTFAAHFPPERLGGVVLGITGDYGEAIYQVVGNWPGCYHTHLGMWCGDPLAVADWRRFLAERYGTIEKLNQAWRTTNHASFAELEPFTRRWAPGPRAWLDLVAWYRGAMTDYADWWMGAARDVFGDTPLYLCTGGDMIPPHGSDFSAQAKIAAKHGGGVRITNEATGLPGNVYLTRLVASAGRHYGAFFSNEPAARVYPVGSLGRLFNARTSGARQVFYYGRNVIDEKGPNEAWHLLHDHRAQMKPFEPCVDVAVMYPTSAMVLDEKYPIDFFMRLRERFDYDFVDERMMVDEALDHYRILVVNSVDVAPAEVIEAIIRWVENGGILLTLNSRIQDLDGNSERWERLIGMTAESDETIGHTSANCLAPDRFPSFTDAPKWTFRRAISHLSDDCEVMVRMAAETGGASVWAREAGKGRVMAYWGVGELITPEGEWLELPPLALYFLRDALADLVKTQRLDRVPGSLWLEDSPLFLSESKDRRLRVAFNAGDAPVELASGGRTVSIPGRSMVDLDES